MIRFLFRAAAVTLLAVGVIFAVLDATRTIAADDLVLTPLEESWHAASPDSLAMVHSMVVRELHPLLWDPVLTFVLALPGWLVFAALSLAFYAIGHKPRSRYGRLVVHG